jgi:hypothetical protein
MAEQLEKTKLTEPQGETFMNATEQERIDHVAEEVAEKASQTEKKYDRDHQIFSK